MDKTFNVMLLLVSASSTAVAATQAKTDWSGGSTTAITGQWGNQFTSSTNMAWRSKSGQTSLSAAITSKRVQTIIAGDAQMPYGIAVGDLNGDGFDDVLTAHPTTNPSAPLNSPDSRGAIYWWQHKQLGNSWVRKSVTEDFYGVHFVDVFDFDHDGDLDVLAVAPYGVTNPPVPAPSTRNGRYAWVENVNGDGSARTKH